jgi:hypothetical protein
VLVDAMIFSYFLLMIQLSIDSDACAKGDRREPIFILKTKVLRH